MHTAVFTFATDDARALYRSVCQEMGDVLFLISWLQVLGR